METKNIEIINIFTSFTSLTFLNTFLHYDCRKFYENEVANW